MDVNLAVSQLYELAVLNHVLRILIIRALSQRFPRKDSSLKESSTTKTHSITTPKLQYAQRW